MKKKIFISYRRDSAEDFARDISQKLADRGCDVFYDHDSLQTENDEFAKRISAEIESTDYFLLIISETTFDERIFRDNSTKIQDYVKYEIEQALEQEKTIIPILIHGVSFPTNVPTEIEKLQHYTALEVRQAYYTQSIKLLYKRLRMSYVSKKRLATIYAGIALLIFGAGLTLLFQYIYNKVPLLEPPTIISHTDREEIHSGRHTIKIQWEPVYYADAYSYTIQCLNGAPEQNEFGVIIGESITDDTSFCLSASELEQGKWYRISVKATAISEDYSDSAWTHLYLYCRYSINIIYPKEEQISCEQDLIVQWDKVPNAIGYTYRVFQSVENPEDPKDYRHRIIAEGTTEETLFLISNELLEESYWYVISLEAITTSPSDMVGISWDFQAVYIPQIISHTYEERTGYIVVYVDTPLDAIYGVSLYANGEYLYDVEWEQKVKVDCITYYGKVVVNRGDKVHFSIYINDDKGLKMDQTAVRWTYYPNQ